MSIEIRGPIYPPGGAAFTQRDLGAIDRLVGLGLRRTIATLLRVGFETQADRASLRIMSMTAAA